MNKFTTLLYKRDALSTLLQAPIDLTCSRFGWNVLGGPERAVLIGRGPTLRAWELTDMLRSGVEVIDHTGEYVWWGFINSVRITLGKLSITFSLDGTYNHIRVAYTKRLTGSTGTTRSITAAEIEQDSIDRYGQIELIYTAGDMTSTLATSLAGTLWTALTYPIAQTTIGGAVFRPRNASGQFVAMPDDMGSRTAGDIDVADVEVQCKGWWHTLDWRYVEEDETGDVATTTQISNLVTEYGAMLTGCDITDASGISVSDFKRGDQSALSEITNLLSVGTSAKRRLLATVSRARKLNVYAEPLSTSPTLKLGFDGKLTVLTGAHSYATYTPAGQWATLRDVFATLKLANSVSQVDSVFVEACEYDCIAGEQGPTLRGNPLPFNLGVKQG